ncbi:pentatricopeptide repeat-containing protein At3g24000, mitochondrial-like [Aristolochia californica]|uniref:pentatricopeptide repeat-containing protein At3g24000, mitochondrial-like n=1 Tax=Aristolochia californica TaxID=171875 RepID=UPI0035D72846
MCPVKLGDPITIADPRLLHARAVTSAIRDIALFNYLITLYARSPSTLAYSSRLLQHLPVPPNVISWTALVSAHANSPLALQFFVSMLRYPVLPNQRTIATLLKTCASLSFLSSGLQLHSIALKLSLSCLPYAGSALVHFYSKCKLTRHARQAFDEIPHRDEVCYAAAIVGLAQNSCSEDALSLFADMKSAGVGSTMYSVSGALRAAAEAAALEQCRVLHAHSIAAGLELNLVVGTALVDAYGKAGMVSDARRAFDGLLPQANIVGWNSVMAAYAQHGDAGPVLELFNEMQVRGLSPDELTFLALLTALSNSGAVQQTERWLHTMEANYKVRPGLEHYTCVVGAVARSGHVEEALRITETMPFQPDSAVWRTLLSACVVHGNANVGETANRRLLELDPQDDAAYVMIANIHAAAGRWTEVAGAWTAMKGKGVKKEGGRSWIEVRGEVHVFMAGDRKHPQTAEVYAKIDELMEKITKLGYAEMPEVMLHEVEAAEKRKALWYHSEKLAVAFGLVSGSVPYGKPVRVVKNLRICRDCHEAFKYMSTAIAREIVVRDVNRYHRFENGSCTCKDYW